jgi:DNA-binding transcriptional ArsR family regulator
MGSSNSTESPLEELSAGAQATSAFKLLGNNTRLAILVALWESYHPYGEVTAMRFSELCDRVGTTDSGQFNYHLERLNGHFVKSTDEGYELSEAGLKFVRSVIAGTGMEERTLDPSEVDTSCTLCGGTVKVKYETGWVYVFCTECNGLWTGNKDQQKGHLAQFALDPAGLTNRSPNEIYAAAWVRTFQRLYNMIEGVCPTCSGQVERSLDICDPHESVGMCSNCGRHGRIIARLHCTVCKDWIQTTMGGIAKYHPAVVEFCYNRGFKLQYGFNDLEHINERLKRATSNVKMLSTDPPRVRVTTEFDGDEIWLEFDENLTVAKIKE